MEIKYIDKRIEPFSDKSNYSQNLLFEIGDIIDLDKLTSFCSQEKAKIVDGMFHIFTFFDKKENAGFPNNPSTGGYNDGDAGYHVKASYIFNLNNGYSKLTVYEKNSQDSRPYDIDV